MVPGLEIIFEVFTRQRQRPINKTLQQYLRFRNSVGADKTQTTPDILGRGGAYSRP